jgi:hypothetical protein
MSSDAPQIDPVHVHIASSDVPAGQQGRRRRRAVYQTVLLQAGDQCQPILPVSPLRKAAFVIGVDQAIVIGGNQSDVASLVGATIPQSVAWPVEDDGQVYAAATPALTGNTTARVSVMTVYEDGEWLA